MPLPHPVYDVSACHGAAAVAALLTAHSPSPSDIATTRQKFPPLFPVPVPCRTAPHLSLPSILPSHECVATFAFVIYGSIVRSPHVVAAAAVVIVVASVGVAVAVGVAIVPADALRVFSRAKRLQRGWYYQKGGCYKFVLS